MRICSVAHALPSQLVTNDELVDRVTSRQCEALTATELESIRRYLTMQLERMGACTRYHRADSEKAFGLGLTAGKRALEGAGLDPASIDLLIYVGVGRGFVEPATANAFQSELQLSNATCFDVVDACASWLRGVDVAHHLLSSGSYKRAMVLNCEANFREYQPKQVLSRDDVELLWAGMTVGEAATATVLTASEQHDTHYRTTFRSAGAQLTDCQIPLPHAAEFLNGHGRAYEPAMQFYARPEALARGAIRLLFNQFWQDPVLSSLRYDIVFGHSVSVPVSRAVQ